MGQQKEGAKNNEKKPASGADAKKVKSPPAKESTVVLEIKCSCDGCITKIEEIIRKGKGVSSVAVDKANDLVTVKGTLDVQKLISDLTEKVKRVVEVDDAKSVDEKKACGGGGGKEEEPKMGTVVSKTKGVSSDLTGKRKRGVDVGDGKSVDEKKACGGGGGKEEEAKMSTVYLEIKCSCQGCIAKIKKIKKKKGVSWVAEAIAKNLVTEKGAMEKLGRVDEVGDAKSIGEKKGCGGGGGKVDAAKMEYHGYGYPQPSYCFDGHVYDQNYSMVPVEGSSSSSSHPYQYQYNQGCVDQGYENPGYMTVLSPKLARASASDVR